MKNILQAITYPFRSSMIKGYLVRGGKGANVAISKVTLQQSIIIIYAIILRLESVFEVDRRYIMNKVLDLDTAAKKDRKAIEKQVRQQMYKNKK